MIKKGLFGISFINKRPFTTISACRAKVRRGHGGGGSSSIKRKTIGNKNDNKTFKPINRIRQAVDKEHDEMISNLANEHSIKMKWKEFIDNKEERDVEETIKLILEKIIGFSDYSKLEQLEPTLWKLLKKQVVKYDMIVGPNVDDSADGEIQKFEFPNDLKMGIIQCRENKDYGSMLRLYDYFFQLLVKSPMMQEIENREELCRINFIDDGEDGSNENENMIKLMEGLDDSRKEYKDGEYDEPVRIYEGKLIKKIEKEWYDLKEPRNLKIYHKGFNQLVGLLNNERWDNKFEGKFIDDFIKDLIKSGMRLEYEEIEIMIKNIIRFQKFDEEMYNMLKNDILHKEMGIDIITPNIYKIFLNGALLNNEFKLFERVIEEFSNENYLIDREIFQFLTIYYSKIGDIEKMMNVLWLEIMEFKVILFTEDLKIIIDSLIRVGLRSVGVDLMKSLIIITEGFDEMRVVENEAKEDNGRFERELIDPMLDLNLLFSYYGSDSIMVKPEINSDIVKSILITSEDIKEYEKLKGMIMSVEDFEIDCEMIKVELLIKEKFGVYSKRDEGFEEFQKSMVNALERLSMEEIDKLVMDVEFLEVFVKIVEHFIAIGVVDGEDGDVARAMGGILVAREAHAQGVAREATSVANVRGALRLERYGEVLRHVLVLARIEG